MGNNKIYLNYVCQKRDQEILLSSRRPHQVPEQDVHQRRVCFRCQWRYLRNLQPRRRVPPSPLDVSPSPRLLNRLPSPPSRWLSSPRRLDSPLVSSTSSPVRAPLDRCLPSIVMSTRLPSLDLLRSDTTSCVTRTSTTSRESPLSSEASPPTSS